MPLAARGRDALRTAYRVLPPWATEARRGPRGDSGEDDEGRGAHQEAALEGPPGELEDDPVYRRYPADWERFHTRYVTPDRFVRGLR